MNTAEAKEFVLETCKSPMQMDIAQMERSGLWPCFRVVEYERLTDMEDRDRLQEFMVWLETDTGGELAQHNIKVWLESLPDWPWRGHWCFVVKYAIPNQPRHEWTFEVVRFALGGWSTRKTDAVPKWPDRHARLKAGEQI